jgi:CubicO group peptidase (beta-lactamase class C family)
MSRSLKCMNVLLILAVACQPVASPTSPTVTLIPTHQPASVALPSETPIPILTRTPPAASTQTLPISTPTSYRVAEEIDTYLNSLVEANAFSGAVLVAQDSQILLSRGYGLANRAQDVPNTPQTRFRICSITKQFTAIGALILQARGQLSVNDPICDYLPQCPSAWEGITIHHLLTHTSGIPDFVDLPDYESTKSLPTTPLQLMARFRDETLQFDPGARWQYSNSGYIILGYIIEQVSGQAYGAFIQDNIFDLLQMNDSGYDNNLEVIATGYTGTGNRWNEASYIDASVPYAAGALYSTVDDMYRWDQALYTEQLVPQESLDAMFTPYASSPIGDYGYGWFITDKHRRRVVRHGGGGDGFVTVMERYPNDRVTLILLSNRETANIGSITDTIAEMVFGE